MQPAIGPIPAPPPQGSVYAARIHQVQVDALRRMFPFALAGSLITACFSVFALLDVLPRQQILLWIAVTLVVGALRLGAMLAYDRRRADPAAARIWVRRMLVGNLCSGILWACRSHTGRSSFRWNTSSFSSSSCSGWAPAPSTRTT
ncbi:hypothetical protein [Achromobacter animicus]|uniref:hypothetical protein n=1 Tax=Achromobacter animicus TaxID=1389935 RepID=UPI001FEAFD0E|nr:hypothetical protein [Achromobacter animicus]